MSDSATDLTCQDCGVPWKDSYQEKASWQTLVLAPFGVLWAIYFFYTVASCTTSTGHFLLTVAVGGVLSTLWRNSLRRRICASCNSLNVVARSGNAIAPGNDTEARANDAGTAADEREADGPILPRDRRPDE